MAEMNFDAKQYTPVNALAEAMQRKAQMEAEMQKDPTQRVLRAVQTGSEIASNMMKTAVLGNELRMKRKQEQAEKNLVDQVGKQHPEVGIPHSPEVIDKANNARRFEQALAEVNPEEYTKQQIRNQSPEELSQKGRFQQSGLEYIDENGQPVTVATKFDTTTGQHFDPISGKELKTPEDLKGLNKRGYAQSTRPGGYTADGREITVDTRTGAKRITGIDDNGKVTSEPYNGPSYPKLENPPAGFTDAMAELSNSEVLLKQIAESFDPKLVGPIAARANKISKYVESLSDEQKVTFYGNVAEYKNSIIKAITGAQMSETEAKRIIQQIPDENASPTAFMAGLKRSYLMTSRRINEQEKSIKRSGGVVRGERDVPITEEDLNALINEKLGNINKPSGPSGDLDMNIDALGKALGLKKRTK